MKRPAYDEYDYLGAMEDCHAAVDELARVVLRTGDPHAAWWLLANHAKRVNCYPAIKRDKLLEIVEAHRSPPTGGTWKRWLGRRAVARTHPVEL